VLSRLRRRLKPRFCKLREENEADSAEKAAHLKEGRGKGSVEWEKGTSKQVWKWQLEEALHCVWFTCVSCPTPTPRIHIPSAGKRKHKCGLAKTRADQTKGVKKTKPASFLRVCASFGNTLSLSLSLYPLPILIPIPLSLNGRPHCAATANNLAQMPKLIFWPQQIGIHLYVHLDATFCC